MKTNLTPSAYENGRIVGHFDLVRVTGSFIGGSYMKYRTISYAQNPCFIGPVITCAQLTKLKKRLEYIQTADQQRARSRAAYQSDKPGHIAYQKSYRAANRDKVLSAGRAYYQDHREEMIRAQYERKRKRVAGDPLFAMLERIRCRTRAAIVNQWGTKSKRTIELLGCVPAHARAHIEAQFLPGMTWDNNTKDGWHIDHIIPCAAFDLTDPDHQAMCFHYTNLRPVWGRENLSKGDRITPDAIAMICAKMESVETDGPFCAIAE